MSEKSASMFQSDALVSLRYLEDRCRTVRQPEEKLALAILEDAVDCFQENYRARQGRRKRLFDNVRKWIFNGEDDWVFGFENICAILELDPEYLRGGLLRWRNKELSKRPNLFEATHQLLTVCRYDRMAARATP